MEVFLVFSSRLSKISCFSFLLVLGVSCVLVCMCENPDGRNRSHRVLPPTHEEEKICLAIKSGQLKNGELKVKERERE